MTRATKTKTMTGLRIDDDLLARIDALARRIMGLSVPRSEVIRLAIRTGLDVLERGAAVARGLDAVEVVVEIDDPAEQRRECEIDEPIPMRPTEAADRVAELEREVERLRARLSAAHDERLSESQRQQCAAWLAVWDAIPPDVTSLTACAGRTAEQVAVDYVRAAGAARAAGWRAACERIAKECDGAHRAELALARDYEARGLRGSARDYEARAETAAELARAARRIASEGLY
jgi:predicted transcriptional regulator